MQYVLIIIFGVMNSDHVSTTTERLGPYATWNDCLVARDQATFVHVRKTNKTGWQKRFYVIADAMCVKEPTK